MLTIHSPLPFHPPYYCPCCYYHHHFQRKCYHCHCYHLLYDPIFQKRYEPMSTASFTIQVHFYQHQYSNYYRIGNLSLNSRENVRTCNLSNSNITHSLLGLGRMVDLQARVRALARAHFSSASAEGKVPRAMVLPAH